MFLLIGAKMPKQPQSQSKLPRPAYADLLSDVLEDVRAGHADEKSPAARSKHYNDWEKDHSQAQRFYVTGFGWLDRACATRNISFLCEYKGGVASVVAETDWREFVADWEDGIACKQIRRAKKEKRPVYFHKAALILATAELALADMIEKGKTANGINNSLLVYRHMKIKPAVWNIDAFNMSYLDSLGDVAIQRLADEISQGVDLLTDLATGHTVTLATANLVKETAERLFPDKGAAMARQKAWATSRLGQ
jgi:hypothetical protein